MNDKKLAKRLEHDIDHLLDGHFLPNDTGLGNEYHQAIEAARLLAQHDVSSESRIREPLRQELLTRISDRRKVWSSKEKGNFTMKPRNKFFVSVGILVVLFGVAMSLPPVRAFAQDLLMRVGPLVIVSQPDVPVDEPSADFTPTPVFNSSGSLESLPAPTNPTLKSSKDSESDAVSRQPTPVPTMLGLQSITPQEALTRLNFKVLMPSYIPDGYTLIGPPNFVQVQTHLDRIVSAMMYITVDYAYLSITQETFNEQNQVPFPISDTAEVTHVAVHGKEAVFVNNGRAVEPVWVEAAGQVFVIDYLMWEENGYFFMIEATELTQEEMSKIAESLK
jgi:hypothetical protein